MSKSYLGTGIFERTNWFRIFYYSFFLIFFLSCIRGIAISSVSYASILVITFATVLFFGTTKKDRQTSGEYFKAVFFTILYVFSYLLYLSVIFAFKFDGGLSFEKPMQFFLSFLATLFMAEFSVAAIKFFSAGRLKLRRKVELNKEEVEKQRQKVFTIVRRIVV